MKFTPTHRYVIVKVKESSTTASGLYLASSQRNVGTVVKKYAIEWIDKETPKDSDFKPVYSEGDRVVFANPTPDYQIVDLNHTVDGEKFYAIDFELITAKVEE